MANVLVDTSVWVDFQSAGESLRDLRSKGFQVPTTDGLIASLFARHPLSLLTLDKHFEHFHQLKKLKV